MLFVVDVVTGFFFAANMLHALHVPARVCAGYYQLLVSNGWGVATLYRTKVCVRGGCVAMRAWHTTAADMLPCCCQGTFWIDLATTLPWVMQLLAPAFSSNKAAAKSLLAVMMLLRLVRQQRGTSACCNACLLRMLTSPSLVLQARLVRVVDLVKHLARGQLLPHSSRSMMLVGSWYLLSLCYCGLVSVNLLGCVWYLAGTIDSAEGSWLESVGGRDMLAAPIWDRCECAACAVSGWRADSMPCTNTEQHVRCSAACCDCCRLCGHLLHGEAPSRRRRGREQETRAPAHARMQCC